jgi:alpha-beta hydrolase superfamily lysophospholipase
MTTAGLKDELLDAQLLRTLGSTASGGADVGECLTTAARVRGVDLDSWYDEWTRTARRVLAHGEAAQDRGDLLVARSAFLRASSYFRTAGVMLMGPSRDPRLVMSNADQTDAFRRGASLLPNPPELLEIPYDGTSMPGYLFRVDADRRPRATVVLTGGYDGTAEELYFFTGAAALARGYNVVAFDGPGQGAMLLQRGVVLRADWEAVITPVIDYISSQPGIDPNRIALFGLSLGANLAPRAASAEHRLAACVADCGSYDLYASAIGRIPKPLVAGLDSPLGKRAKLLERVLDFLASKPTAGWAIRRGQLVHGAATPIDYLRSLREYTLVDRAARITCPTFVCNADHDDIGATAHELFAALTCPKKFVTFTEADGAGDHCEAAARSIFHDAAFTWLDDILHPDV